MCLARMVTGPVQESPLSGLPDSVRFVGDDSKPKNSRAAPTAPAAAAATGLEEFDMTDDELEGSTVSADISSIAADAADDSGKPPGPDTKFIAGQHRGSTYHHVATSVTGYVAWGEQSRRSQLH